MSDHPRPDPPIALTRRARKTYRALAEHYPGAHCGLEFRNPLQLLVATMLLTARTTDAGVNRVTPQIFYLFRTAADYATADRVKLEKLVKPTGFHRSKTDSLIKLGAALVERFEGEVPDRLEDLLTLPGVGRNMANVLLGNAFGVPGITVDIDFGRVSRRLGWTKEEDPVKVEQAVGDLFPEEDWTRLSNVLTVHGQRTCHEHGPACGVCPVGFLCPSTWLPFAPASFSDNSEG